MLVRELAEMLGAVWEGEGDREIVRAAPLENAGAADVSFVAGGQAAKQAVDSQSGCLLVPLNYPNRGQTVIRVSKPRDAMAQVISSLHPKPKIPPGVHATAEIAAGVSV